MKRRRTIAGLLGIAGCLLIAQQAIGAEYKISSSPSSSMRSGRIPKSLGQEILAMPEEAKKSLSFLARTKGKQARGETS